MKIRNYGDKNVDLSIAEFMEIEENTNLVNLKVEDEPKTNFVKFDKKVTGLNTEIVINSKKVLSPEEEYKIKVEYDLPEYAKRLNGSFIVKEIFQKSKGIQEADEFHIIYRIPKMFPKYKFWKKLCLVASDPSRKNTEENKQVLEYDFNLRTGSRHSISFVYWVKTRKMLVIPLTFLGGFFVEKILENILKFTL